jgi:hypothetical protein
MNSTPLTLRAVAFLLIGCTLIGYPTSVFSVSTDDAGEALTSTDDFSVTNDSAEAVVTETVTTQTAPTIVFSDTYRRERLPTTDVFGDFVIGPGKFEIELAPGQSRTVELTVTNRMGEPKIFSFETEDMTGSTDGSQSIVLLGDDRGPYTLKDYIQISSPQFELQHAERARIPVTISLPADAEPGGRYGSLLVSIVSNPNDTVDSNGAAPSSVIISRLGTLFFITTPGETRRSAELRDFSTIGGQTFFASGPVDFSIVFENTGPVHTTPYGQISITNTFGDEVGFFELEPWFVMPQSLRNREVTWNRSFLIGRYTATAQINRGYDDIIDSQSFTFWVIPWSIIGYTFLGFFLFFLLLRFLFSRFEFKRKG